MAFSPRRRQTTKISRGNVLTKRLVKRKTRQMQASAEIFVVLASKVDAKPVEHGTMVFNPLHPLNPLTMREGKTMDEKTKASQVWGKRAADFYAELENQFVQVAVSNGKSFKGELIGVDVYDILIRQETGLELLLPKGNIVYIHRASS